MNTPQNEVKPEDVVLLLCPMCGGKPIDEWAFAQWCIKCTNCELSIYRGGDMKNFMPVVKAWNTRTQAPREEELATLKQQLAEMHEAAKSEHHIGEVNKMVEQHAGDCSFYSSIVNRELTDGICTCGYGLNLISKGDHSQLISKERIDSLQAGCPDCAEVKLQLAEAQISVTTATNELAESIQDCKRLEERVTQLRALLERANKLGKAFINEVEKDAEITGWSQQQVEFDKFQKFLTEITAALEGTKQEQPSSDPQVNKEDQSDEKT